MSTIGIFLLVCGLALLLLAFWSSLSEVEDPAYGGSRKEN